MPKIVIIGPENTGKSTLAQQLGNAFQCNVVTEYAREYLLQNGIAYCKKDLLDIAKGQCTLEDNLYKKENNILICDTNLYVIKIWSEVKYNSCDNWILNQIAKRNYDYYILCDIDLPWQDDPMREHPAIKDRQMLLEMYKDVLMHCGQPFCIVSGDENNRLQIAKLNIEGIFFKKN